MKRHPAGQISVIRHRLGEDEILVTTMTEDYIEWRRLDQLTARDQIAVLVRRIENGDIDTNNVTRRLEE